MRPCPLHLFAALLGAALLSAGCSGPREATGILPDTYPDDSVSEIRQALTRGTDTLRTFRAEARLSVDTPARSGTFSSTVRARRGAAGDSLSMTLRKLGIEGGRILVTPDSFFVYDAVHNELTYGALADAGNALPAPLRDGRAFENLLGLVAPGAGLGWQVRPSTAEEAKHRYVLTSNSASNGSASNGSASNGSTSNGSASNGSTSNGSASNGSASNGSTSSALQRRLAVDPSRWRALRYTERTSDGTLLEERQFSAFGHFGGLFLPRRVELRRPQDQSSASVYYRDLTINPAALPPFDLDVPEGTERTLLAR